VLTGFQDDCSVPLYLHSAINWPQFENCFRAIHRLLMQTGGGLGILSFVLYEMVAHLHNYGNYQYIFISVRLMLKFNSLLISLITITFDQFRGQQVVSLYFKCISLQTIYMSFDCVKK